MFNSTDNSQTPSVSEN